MLSQLLHKELGEQLASLGLYGLLATGNHSEHTVDMALASGLNRAVFFDNKAQLIDYLLKNISNGDWVIVKGSRAFHMEDVVNALTKESAEE